ncbi:hypothetical protein ACVWZ8_003805 [Arthrobacter sp. UYCu723]
MTVTQPRGRGHRTTEAGPTPDLAAPYCTACGTDRLLIFDVFVPPRVLPDGRPLPATVSYTCGKCGRFSSHTVPPAWTPPGWQWYV